MMKFYISFPEDFINFTLLSINKGQSFPIFANNLRLSLYEILNLYFFFKYLKTVTAFEDAPPSPDPFGIFFFTRTIKFLSFKYKNFFSLNKSNQK